MDSPLQRLADGDQDSVQACVDRYGGMVYRLAHRYLGNVSGEIEDGVQEVFMELWLHADRFDASKGSDATFVATLAHHRLIDYKRRLTVRSRAESEKRTIDRQKAGREHERSNAERDEDLAKISDSLDGLVDEERTALWLSLKCGLSASQISTATGTPIGTAKSRLRRALKRVCVMPKNDPVGSREGATR